MPSVKQTIASPSCAASSPEAIQACVSMLAAEAFELGHHRVAQLLAEAAAELSRPAIWKASPAM